MNALPKKEDLVPYTGGMGWSRFIPIPGEVLGWGLSGTALVIYCLLLERMNLFEANMEIKQILERLVRRFPPREQLRHFAVDVLSGACLHVADDVVQPLVVPYREPCLAAVACSTLELRVQFFDVALGQRSTGGFNHEIDAAEMIRRLHYVINREVSGERADCHRLENPTRLFMCEATAFHVVCVVCEVNLQPVIEPA